MSPDIKARRIVLAARPEGRPRATDFRLESFAPGTPGPGEVLVQTRFLSLDPYMRGRMSAARSYAPPVEIGATMEGGTVSEVVAASPDAGLAVGDVVLAHAGWTTHAVTRADRLTKLDPDAAPLSTALGVLGMPGFTAYSGLLTIGEPQAGETVVVAAATGPVGSAVGQIARIKGARAVGIAGGPEKCAYLRDELGFDAAIDHRAPDFAAQLKEACPNGIDVYFENVAGAVLEAVLPLLNDRARIPVCGVIAQYNATGLPPGPDQLPAFMRLILTRSLRVRGFINREFEDQRPAFLKDMSTWIRDGRVRYREDIVDGLENAPEAFIGLLEGRNFGKLLIRVS